MLFIIVKIITCILYYGKSVSGLGSILNLGSTLNAYIFIPTGILAVFVYTRHNTLPHHDQSSFQTWIIKKKYEGRGRRKTCRPSTRAFKRDITKIQCCNIHPAVGVKCQPTLVYCWNSCRQQATAGNRGSTVAHLEQKPTRISG